MLGKSAPGEGLYIAPLNDAQCVVYDVDSGYMTICEATVEQIMSADDVSMLHYEDKIVDELPEKRKRSIDYLMIGTTEACNLQCKYCYAESGTYGHSEHKMMSFDEYKEMLEKVLKFCCPAGLQGISLFGGEPTLNFEETKKFVDYADKYLPSLGYKKPQWGIVTNGTLINSDMIALFNKHNISVTVSLDGPKYVNDMNRIYADSKKSVFDTVSEKMRLMQERSFILSCESTLAKKFFEQYTKGSYTDYINSMYELGFDYVINVVAYHPDSREAESGLAQKVEDFYTDMVDHDFGILIAGEDISRLNNSVLTAIDRLIKPKYYAGCGAGINSIFYSANGDIYSCHIYYEKRAGRLSMDEILNTEGPVVNRAKIPACKNCWCKNVCFSWCPGSDLLLDGEENEISCLGHRMLFEQVIIQLAKVTQDEVLFERFGKNLERALQEISEKGIVSAME